MRLQLKYANVDELLSCVGDYINQELDVDLRDFVVSLNLDHLNSAYIYTTEWGLQPYACPNFDGPLHIHEDLSNCHLFCTRLEIVVLLFLKNSLYHEMHGEVIETLHDWLPSASAHVVDVLFDTEITSTSNIVNSYFEPSYAYKFIHAETRSDTLTYNYITTNIEYTSYCISENNKTIMVRARSRSRSRSRSPGRPARKSNRRRSRSRSRSRSKSPVRRTTARPYRRRSRSRSTSRSRY